MVGGVQQAVQRRLGKAVGRRQRDRRVVGCHGDADRGILRSHGALGGGDVGPALQQSRGHAGRDAGSAGIVVLCGISSSSGFLPTSTAIACAYWARATPSPIRLAWAVSSATRAVMTAEGGVAVIPAVDPVPRSRAAHPGRPRPFSAAGRYRRRPAARSMTVVASKVCSESVALASVASSACAVAAFCSISAAHLAPQVGRPAGRALERARVDHAAVARACTGPRAAARSPKRRRLPSGWPSR